MPTLATVTRPAPASPASAPAAAEERPSDYRFRLDGDVRRVTFAGHSASVRERIGYAYIEHLLRRPLQCVTAIELRSAVQGRDRLLFTGSCGTRVTTETLVDLKRACLELQEERDEARERGDARRQEELELELARLTDEVRRLVGKTGKPRRVDDAERTRIAVTKAIARARWALGRLLPDLKTYLEQAISTGAVCMYRPRERLPWEL
jgi:hypothetical protein